MTARKSTPAPVLAAACRCERRCTGVLGGPWCGERATTVCTDAEQLQWFACDEHASEGLQTEPIAEWFERNGLA